MVDIRAISSCIYDKCLRAYFDLQQGLSAFLIGGPFLISKTIGHPHLKFAVQKFFLEIDHFEVYILAFFIYFE